MDFNLNLRFRFVSHILGWATQELVDFILESFVSLSDYLRFGDVCTAWNTAALENINYLLPQQLPMLIVSNDAEDICNHQRKEAFSTAIANSL